LADNPEDDFVSYEPPPEGAYRELGIGALQGATTDLGGSFADIGAAATGIASQIDPRLLRTSPIASALSAADPYAQSFVKNFGSEALGSRFFPAAESGLEDYRDLGRLAGGITGAGELITARGAKAVSSGIEDFMQYLRPQAVTPDGQVMPLPDTSVTEMLASADTPGMNPKYTKDIKKAEKTAQDRLEAGEDPRKVFEDTGFMRINVDARPGREAGDAPLETKMVFDIPDNLSQINVGKLLPESVSSLVANKASAKEVMDAFEKLKDPRNFFVESFYKGGDYGRSVQFKLNQAIGDDHPLFTVFPDLADDINVRFVEKMEGGTGGHWDDSTNTIAINAEYLGNDRYTSTLMVHELAHVLQTRGDLPGGGQPFLVKESVSGKLFDNFALYESLKMIDEPGATNFNPYEFFNELRPKGEAKNLEKLVNAARFNVKNANPEAPDNLTKMWPGNTNSTAPVNLDEMPYANEVKAEMYRLIAEKEAKAFKEAEAYQSLGINVYRDRNESGSLRQGSSARQNYMKTRGEFMARLQEAYALATEGMPVDERRKLFPMDVATKGARATKEAPGGQSASLEIEKRIRPGLDVMAGTSAKSFDTEGAERGLVDIEGLINVDKLPENLKSKLEYPKRGPAPASAPIKLRDDTQPPFTVEEGAFPRYDFTNSAPIDSDNVGGFVSMVDTIHVPTGTRIPAESLVRGHKADFERAPGIPPLDSDTARRLLVGEISLDEARKELVRKNLKVVDKAEGGVITLADVARNMNRGPRGVAALAPIARNMNRPMVS
jgi:hypothetical protein